MGTIFTSLDRANSLRIPCMDLPDNVLTQTHASLSLSRRIFACPLSNNVMSKKQINIGNDLWYPKHPLSEHRSSPDYDAWTSAADRRLHQAYGCCSPRGCTHRPIACLRKLGPGALQMRPASQMVALNLSLVVWGTSKPNAVMPDVSVWFETTTPKICPDCARHIPEAVQCTSF